MYSFDSRSDTVATDEPLYANHLITNDHLERPYKDQLLASQPYASNTKEQLDILQTPKGSNYTFFKHMGKHFPLLNLSLSSAVESPANFLLQKQHKHIILVRDPLKVLMSWENAVKSGNAAVCSLEEIGLPDLVSAYETLTTSSVAATSNNVVVVDSDALLIKPEKTLKSLCALLEILFDPAMLSWEKGPKKCDGIWAPWWYKNAHESTSFSAPAANQYRTLPPALLPLFRNCLPFYEVLRAKVISDVDFKIPYEDPRNANVMCYIGQPGNGSIVPREMARISPFDSAVQGGDAAWEGLRIYRG